MVAFLWGSVNRSDEIMNNGLVVDHEVEEDRGNWCVWNLQFLTSQQNVAKRHAHEWTKKKAAAAAAAAASSTDSDEEDADDKGASNEEEDGQLDVEDFLAMVVDPASVPGRGDREDDRGDDE